MKLNSIVNRYIITQFIPPFAINLGFFTFIFLMAEMLKITDLIVNYNVSILDIAKILTFSTPYFLVFIIPMSCMMSVLLTFLRMSSDNEIIALKTGGVSIYRLLPPVLIFCLCGCLLTFFMSLYGMHKGRSAIKELTFQVFSSNLDFGLKERTFNDNFEDVMLYVNRIDVQSKSLIDVFIEDKRREDVVSTVIAPRGELFSEPEQFVFHLRLYDGIINQVGLEKRSAHSISFDVYDLRLDLRKAAKAAGGRKHRKEMSIFELQEAMQGYPVRNKDYYKMLLTYHQKFAIPFACFALGVLAMPLGIQSKSARRSSGLVLGLICFLFYYLLLSFGMVFGETGAYPPLIGMWVPNFVMGTLGIILLVQTANERPIRLTATLGRLRSWLLRVISRRR
jgi:lipopolysaccharide export system permease protein